MMVDLMKQPQKTLRPNGKVQSNITLDADIDCLLLQQMKTQRRDKGSQIAFLVAREQARLDANQDSPDAGTHLDHASR
jgi:hypothetical protein